MFTQITLVCYCVCSKMYAIIIYLFCLLQLSHQTVPRVVIDVDGGIDDLHALTFCLNADTQKLIKIEAITCVKGDTDLEKVEDNIIRFLDTAGRLDIPIYSGAYRPLVLPEKPLPQWYGADGFADVDIKKKPDFIKNMNAAEFVNNLVKAYPDEITLIALGPLTNFGVAAILYKDFMQNIKDMYIMGGNYGTKRVDFNFLSDPEAAHTVLDLTVKPTTLFTFQACSKSGVNIAWRLNLTMDNEIWNLIDSAERKQLKALNKYQTYASCDGMLALLFLNPKMVTKSSDHYAYVEIKNKKSYAQLITKKGQKANVNIIENIDKDMYQQLFVDGLKNACDEKLCVNKYL